MNLNDAVKSIQFGKKHSKPKTLYTPWGETLDPDHVHDEYPRPQMVRAEWECLNGYWDYAIVNKSDKENSRPPKQWDGKILVPFSPEASLSGVERQLQPGEYLWYHRCLNVEKTGDTKRCLLHFGAVDERCRGYVNGKYVGSHRGGYLPFTWDITDYLKDGENHLHLVVADDSEKGKASKGKQKLHRGGMFYTAQSGIWQTVWMEWVPENYIESFHMTPDIDKRQLTLEIHTKQSARIYRASVYDQEKMICSMESDQNKMILDIPNQHLWSPEDPFLYTIEIEADEDRVDSYFAMRQWTLEKDDDGILRTCLNHQFYFQNGLLDQGYWPDGLYTPPSDEALVYDVQAMKQLGFNMLRKHAKIESLRWYYHCDRLGMIVWQDMVNGGDVPSPLLVTYLPTGLPAVQKLPMDLPWMTGRKDKKVREAWILECDETVQLLYNCPSLACWVPFNEGWGQFDTQRVTDRIRTMDATRFIDAASGWFDLGCGDFVSEHNYFRKLEVHPDGKRAFVLSEYGGYACHVDGHSAVDEVYGYKTYEDTEKLNNAFWKMMTESVEPLIKKGLCAAVYTQVSDIEEEVNGVLTYDRKVCKIYKKINKIKKNQIIFCEY